MPCRFLYFKAAWLLWRTFVVARVLLCCALLPFIESELSHKSIEFFYMLCVLSLVSIECAILLWYFCCVNFATCVFRDTIVYGGASTCCYRSCTSELVLVIDHKFYALSQNINYRKWLTSWAARRRTRRWDRAVALGRCLMRKCVSYCYRHHRNYSDT